MTLLAEYLAVVLLDRAERKQDEELGGSINKLTKDLRRGGLGLRLNEQDVASAIEILEPFAAAEQEYSPLTGGYWTVSFDNFRYYFVEDKPDQGDDAALYAQLKGTTAQYPILMAFARRGRNYAEDANAHLAAAPQERWDELRTEASLAVAGVPASDRVVRLDDNAAAFDDVSRKLTEVISAVDSNNGSEDESGADRDRLKAELRAGEQLLKGRYVRVAAIVQVLIKPLKYLTEKFAGAAIGALAKDLMEHLLRLLA